MIDGATALPCGASTKAVNARAEPVAPAARIPYPDSRTLYPLPVPTSHTAHVPGKTLVKSTAPTASSGSLTYVCLLTAVAALGGLLFGYDTAVIAGAIGFLKAHFELGPGMEGWAVSNVLVGCMAGAIGRRYAQRPLGPQTGPADVGRPVCRLGRRGGPATAFLRVRDRPLPGRAGRGHGLDPVAAVHRRSRPAADPRPAGVAQPGGHYPGHARGFPRQLAHQSTWRPELEREHGLAVDVRLGDAAGGALPGSALCSSGKSPLAHQAGPADGGPGDPHADRRPAGGRRPVGGNPPHDR